MKLVIALVLAGLAACKGSESKLDKVGSGSASRPGDEVAEVASQVKAAMNELANYSERIYKILRETKDCDAAAKQLEALVPAFRELGPRMMKVSDRLAALPEADRERIKRDAEAVGQEIQKRFADAEAIEQKAKECEKTSAAFAAVAPSVAFSKK